MNHTARALYSVGLLSKLNYIVKIKTQYCLNSLRNNNVSSFHVPVPHSFVVDLRGESFLADCLYIFCCVRLFSNCMVMYRYGKF